MTTPADNGAELNQDMPAVGDEEISFAELTGDEPNAYAEAAESPIAVEDFGTTNQEEFEGESLDGRLARELPDTSVDDVPSGYGQGNLPEADPGEGDPGEGDTSTNEEVDDELVGRLVEPDEGARSDEDADAVATDFGGDGGGFTAEEAAMHVDPDS